MGAARGLTRSVLFDSFCVGVEPRLIRALPFLTPGRGVSSYIYVYMLTLMRCRRSAPWRFDFCRTTLTSKQAPGVVDSLLVGTHVSIMTLRARKSARPLITLYT